jgi:hypothetical protein
LSLTRNVDRCAAIAEFSAQQAKIIIEKPNASRGVQWFICICLAGREVGDFYAEQRKREKASQLGDKRGFGGLD